MCEICEKAELNGINIIEAQFATEPTLEQRIVQIAVEAHEAIAQIERERNAKIQQLVENAAGNVVSWAEAISDPTFPRSK